ncbi:MAG TPA: TonB C-terminal domain-containing protein, partial [Steroidobacteraceae bacterium]
RYMGQINARIDRAWLRPRTPIGAASFSCRVRILQDAVGNVTEVMLEQCNGDTRWQLSLVHAIDSSSPLPAPPDPDVFSRIVHLGFTAEAYASGRHEDQYEPERTVSLLDTQGYRGTDLP